MKLSLPFASLLATGLLGSSVLAQTTASAAPTPAAEPASVATASAGPAGPSKVAVIEFQAAVFETNEGKRDLEELQKKFLPKQTQLKQQSDEIDTLKKSLQSSSATLSDTERASRLKTIDDKEKSLQRSGEDAQNDFQQELQQTFAQVAQKVNVSLQGYAQQNGYTVVLDGTQQQQQPSPILFAAQGTDITAAVISAYNQKSGIAAPPPSAPSSSGTTTPRSTTPPVRRTAPPAAAH